MMNRLAANGLMVRSSSLQERHKYIVTAFSRCYVSSYTSSQSDMNLKMMEQRRSHQRKLISVLTPNTDIFLKLLFAKNMPYDVKRYVQ